MIAPLVFLQKLNDTATNEEHCLSTKFLHYTINHYLNVQSDCSFGFLVANKRQEAMMHKSLRILSLDIDYISYSCICLKRKKYHICDFDMFFFFAF